MADTLTNWDQLASLYTFLPNVGTFISGKTEEGEFIEDTEVVKKLVEKVLKDSLGIESPDAASPMGRLVERLALDYATAMRVNVQNANQLVIATAAGHQLDAIALWFGLYRKMPVPSSVEATLRGNEGTVIPAGARARTLDGAVFTLVEPATIDEPVTLEDGTTTYQTTALFRSVDNGPIGCPAYSLTTIDAPVDGWASVFNEQDAVLGRLLETDDSLRARIEASRFSGNGFIYAMKNAIEQIETVNSSMVVANDTGDRKTVNGVDDMDPHSIFVCVDCHEDAMDQVAEAVFNTKPCGTGYQRIQGQRAAEERTVTDAYGNTYPVYLFTPDDCLIKLKFVVKNRSYAGKDILGDIGAAVEAFAAEHGYKIGEDVYAADIIRAVELALPGLIVISCGVSTAGTSQSDTAADLAYQSVAAYQKATFSKDRIEVVI